MPPTRQSNRVADAGNAEPPGERHRIVFSGPDAIGRHRMLEAKPFGAGGAITIPVEPRMVRKNLQAGANDEKHQEQIEKMLPSQPRRKARIVNRHGTLSGIARDEMRDGGNLPQLLRHRNSDDQKSDAERD